MLTKCLKLLSMSDPGEVAVATVCNGLRHSISELIERLPATAAATVINVYDLIPQ